VLTEQGPRKVTRDRVGLVLVLGLVGYKSSGVVVVRKNDAFLGGIETYAKLATSLCSKASRLEGRNLSRKIDCRSLCSFTDFPVGSSVSAAGKAVLMSVGVEGIGVGTPTARAWEVPDKLRVLFVVIHRSHSAGMVL
jgi:hypothetical protein